MSDYTLSDVPIKTPLGAAQKDAVTARLPPNLHQLLVLVNGSRTVAELLRFGVPNVSLESFDALYQRQFIEKGRGGISLVSATEAAAGVRKGLAEARFAVLDKLLDLSEHDFGARPWIERIEKADSFGRLAAEVEAFCLSPFGRKHFAIHATLRQAATP